MTSSRGRGLVAVLLLVAACSSQTTASPSTAEEGGLPSSSVTPRPSPSIGASASLSVAEPSPEPPASDPPTAGSSADPTATPGGAPADTPGRWTAAAPMLRQRQGFDAVVLGDGTVLAVGSDFACQPGGAHPGSETAEVYDPTVDTWMATASLNKPRKSFETVVMPDGEALVLGGINPDDYPYSSTKSYSPNTHSWTSGPLMARAVGEPLAVTLLDGRVLVHGGTADGPSFQIFDPGTSVWSVAAPAPRELDVRALVGSTDGRVLALGISYEDVGEEEEGAANPTTAIYEPGHDRWTTVAGPGFWAWPTFVALEDGDVLAIHGFGLDDVVAPVERFDGKSNEWRSVTPLPVVREFPQVVVMDDGRVLVAGGIAIEPGSPGGTILPRVDIYDPETDRWSRAADLHEPRAEGYAIVLPGGDVLVLGGTADVDEEGETPFCPEPLRTVERFDPSP